MTNTSEYFDFIAKSEQEPNTKVNVTMRRKAVYVEPKTLEHTDEDDVAVFRVVSKSRTKLLPCATKKS
ncbi:hypothetical protein DPMN_135054 [Dreissena polymorpha]|uniref:Uncharacterized protein n=1 Tax=Dreissena polymorpha TaxID=45954 RepID=A0A9D4G162_DREPO|nr:hypothetical protein DPMN_135054 [Dreissena polymorpha]